MSAFFDRLDGTNDPFLKVPFYLIDFLDGNIKAAIFVQRLRFLLKKPKDSRGVFKGRLEWHAETRLTPNEIDAVRKFLREKGYLVETHCGRLNRTFYALDGKAFDKDYKPFTAAYEALEDEIDFTYDGRTMASKLNLSRQEKRAASDQKPTLENRNRSLDFSNRSLESRSPNKEEDKEEDRRADRSDAPSSRRTRRVKPISTSVKSFDTIDSALQGLKENKEARAARRIASGDPAKVVNPKTFPKMKVVNDTWRDVMKEHHPKIPALRLGITDYAKFRACAKQVLETASLYELLDFAASAWGTIVTHDLAWVVRKGGRLPQAPSMQEICRFWKTFSKAFAERSAHAALGEARREATQTNERKLERDNEGLRAELAKRDAEAKKLKDQLRMEKQISTGLSRKLRETPEKKGQTITARRAALPDDIGDDEINFIPDWQKGAQK